MTRGLLQWFPEWPVTAGFGLAPAGRFAAWAPPATPAIGTLRAAVARAAFASQLRRTLGASTHGNDPGIGV
jgi:hypothetical protein